MAVLAGSAGRSSDARASSPAVRLDGVSTRVVEVPTRVSASVARSEIPACVVVAAGTWW